MSSVIQKPPVLTKTDFVRRYKAGEFGNASPTWDSYGEWAQAKGWNYGDFFHVRNRVAGGLTWYNVPWEKLLYVWSVARDKCGERNLYISAMAPTEKTVIQGEVCRAPWMYELTYTRVQKPMRDALRDSTRRARGLEALFLLQENLCQRSYDWLQYLLDTYEDHVVEFSTYSISWGTVPGYNTVFWEVRNY